VQGVYLMPSFGRYEVVAELVRWLRTANARSRIAPS
jgi:erythromycin esterase-like protein